MVVLPRPLSRYALGLHHKRERRGGLWPALRGVHSCCDLFARGHRTHALATVAKLHPVPVPGRADEPHARRLGRTRSMGAVHAVGILAHTSDAALCRVRAAHLSAVTRSGHRRGQSRLGRYPVLRDGPMPNHQPRRTDDEGGRR
jgi:hypothetical protein